MYFCTHCFASELNGSGGCNVINDHCYNCGSGGTAINIPEWAIDMIRENASWVGKRFYPHKEDYDNHEELLSLRKTIKEFPGRKAVLLTEPNVWQVSQYFKDKMYTSIFVTADSETEALELARLKLPYINYEE